MRSQYSDVNVAGGLTLSNFALDQTNILQERKEHQEVLAACMENNLEVNMIELMTASIYEQIENKEHIPPPDNVSANNMYQ